MVSVSYEYIYESREERLRWLPSLVEYLSTLHAYLAFSICFLIKS